VVVNDGDANPPWAELAHILDPRLVRFSLMRNRGCYFVHQVVLKASPTLYFLVQDSDDWSLPNRVSTLLTRLRRDRSDFAFSAWQQHREDKDGNLRPHFIRWLQKEAEPIDPQEPPLFDPLLTDNFVHRASHHGLFRRKALERIGGYYGGFRIHYDTLLTNFLLMTGKVSFVDAPLYQYVIRGDSLSRGHATGPRSPERILVKKQLAAMYHEALHWYRACTKRQISRAELAKTICGLSCRFVTGEDRAAIALEASKLAMEIRCAAKVSGR